MVKAIKIIAWAVLVWAALGVSAGRLEAAEWYVDTGVGLDANPGTAGSPFKTITRALQALNAGDTIHIGPGTYYEKIVIGADSDDVAVIGDFNGADSSNVVIDVNNEAAGNYGIYLNGPTGVTIRSLTVLDAYNGVYLLNADSNAVIDVTANSCHRGIYASNSDHNTFWGNTTNSNSNIGIYLVTNSNHNVLSANRTDTNGYGLHLEGSHYCRVDSGTANGNTNYGIYLRNARYNQVLGNHAAGNLNDGFHIWTSDTNEISGNVASGNVIGLRVRVSRSNTVSGNTVDSNVHGIFLNDGSRDNEIHQNSMGFNTGNGIRVYNSPRNWIRSNLIYSNQSADAAILVFGASGPNNKILQNQIMNSIADSIRFYNSIGADSVMYNNFYGAGGYNFQNAANVKDARFNHYYTTDSTAVSDSIGGLSHDSWFPFRLNAVDTTFGFDVVAPAEVTGVNAVYDSSTDKVTIWWTPVTMDEDNSALTGLNGYSIYRIRQNGAIYDSASPTPYTRVAASETSFVDDTFPASDTYYYVVTAFDTQTPSNEGWFSQQAAVYVEVPGSPPEDDNCFIATAGFGRDHWILSELHRFRDTVLLSSRFGRGCVAAYYQYGPRAAVLITSEFHQTVARAVLMPAVTVAVLMNHAGVVFFLLLVLFSAGGWCYFRA